MIMYSLKTKFKKVFKQKQNLIGKWFTCEHNQKFSEKKELKLDLSINLHEICNTNNLIFPLNMSRNVCKIHGNGKKRISVSRTQ